MFHVEHIKWSRCPEYDEKQFTIYDAIIVIGAGHAGIEASLAVARSGRKVLVVTMNIDTIGQMSCNPGYRGYREGPSGKGDRRARRRDGARDRRDRHTVSYDKREQGPGCKGV